ncbi:MAG TPA: DUF4209 domain-containing protein [Ramlibacter sp.]|uniref:DUF4209 domain-containing protein n=1 Tax=Ramlibacter sp. TaxID=1917967 RepID=UPI002B57692E|nr:DUF4209 domain-containing protein [Ramlibacter sp.]HVZ42525.1 DUF4209 domain-containing protein [Ramlibacter sp.]
MNPPAPLTLEDLLACGWQDAIRDADDYRDMELALTKGAREATDKDQSASAAALALLALACGMQLDLESMNVPFKPMVVLADGRRSGAPEDLGVDQIELLAGAAPLISEPLLRARLADLAWVLRKPRDVQLAITAIDAYRELPLTWDLWIPEGRSHWGRALSLTYSIGKASGTRLPEIEAQVLRALFAAGAQDGFFAVHLSELLLKYRLGREVAASVGDYLSQLGRQTLARGEFLAARGHLEAAAQWMKVAGDGERAAHAVVEVAESWVTEARARVEASRPSFMIAASFYEQAIKTLRTIPRAQRAALKVDERISELRNNLAEAGERSMEEFGSVRTQGIDISTIIANARDAVSGKPVLEALRGFASFYAGPSVSELRKQALQNMRQFPLQALFATQIMSTDGRVVAKVQGAGFGDTDQERNEQAIRHGMVRDFSMAINLVVQGQIVPAHDVLLQEHRLVLGDFITLTRNAPIVPSDRTELLGRALYAGYDRDYVSCIHLLAPQMEHLVRVHLKAAGAKTTFLGSDGIETENGLSTLVELPEASTVFGHDLLFEIRSIYCDPLGPNLRNQVAHGLLDEDASQSIFSVYAWWMALRLVFATFWNRHKRDSNNDADTHAPKHEPTSST